MDDDTVELLVSRTLVPDTEDIPWQFLAETIFAEQDFYQRDRRAAHSIVRQLSGRHAITIHETPKRVNYLYASTATVRRRLQIQGYTRFYCEKVWNEARANHIERTRRISVARSADVEQLNSMSLPDWLNLFRNDNLAPFPGGVTGGRRGPWHYGSLLEELDDVNVRIAMLCDALDPSPVWMDCKFLYADKGESRPPQQIARDELLISPETLGGKIIVLTEGKSDTRIISAGLKALYPEFSEAYQFLDFEEFRIEGGATLLASMIKTLSGARIRNRMLVLFDNDAAGVEAYRGLCTVRFPRNVRLMLLPATPFARRYPTLGPNGEQVMDINGAGAAIELFLGRAALTKADGSLRRVRWTQWHERVGRYQGAVEDKAGATAAFEALLKSDNTPARLRKALPEFDLLLKSILAAFEDLEPDHR